MSLPTYCQFYKNDKLIATHFVNVGWFLTEETWIYSVTHLPWVDCDYAILYGIRIPKSIIDLLKPKPYTEWTDLRAAILSDSFKEAIKKWQIDNDDLRPALRLLYIEQNGPYNPEVEIRK